MKIKTRLRLNTWISLGAIAFMLFSLVWLFNEANRTDQNVFFVDEMKKVAFERIILRDDWLLNQEYRASAQWYSRTKALRKLLETAFQRFPNKETKQILQDIRENFEITDSLFSAILEKHKYDKLAAKNKFVFTEAESRSLSQILLKAHSLNDNISRLHTYANAVAITARNRWIGLAVFFMISTMVWTIINSAIINKILGKRLITLTEEIKIISDGNLDSRIDEAGDDELADLVRLNNEMAAKLKGSYTSLETLKEEVAERKKAEQEGLQNAERFQTIFGQAPLGIALMDSLTGRIYEVNAKFENIIGRTLKEMAKINWMRITHPDDVQEALDNMARLNAGEIDGFQMNIRYLRPNGAVVWINMTIAPIQVTEKTKSLHLCMIEDISDRKAAEAEIKILNTELEQRVAGRTAELTIKTAELERINKIFVDRELRMRELKAKIAKLEEK